MSALYVVRAFDRSGTSPIEQSFTKFADALLWVRTNRTQYETPHSKIVLTNDDRLDIAFDGLTDHEREQFDRALQVPRLASTGDALRGLPCPDCGERGMIRVGDLTYRCRNSGKDGRRFHLRDMMPGLMEGSSSQTRKDAPLIPEQPIEGHLRPAPRLLLIDDKSFREECRHESRHE